MSRLLRGTVITAMAVALSGTTDFDLRPEIATSSVGAQSRAETGPPELPRASVEIPAIGRHTRTIHVPAGGDLQEALEQVRAGERITLEAGATYEGPFRLRRKEGDGWVVIASSGEAPRTGRHVTPADAARMPKLISKSDAVVVFEPGAHHYRLVGLEISPAEGIALNTLVQTGDDLLAVGLLPHHIVIDRSYIHGDARLGGRRGVSLNAAHAAVVDSYLSDFKERTVDAQAISGWNGPGPFRIAGNYLEASGENVMFGGADPRIRDLVPSDIEIVRNHFAKPLKWKKDHREFEGTEWSVKNLFELKNARRVVIDGNLFEYNWPQAQNGFAILFTVRNQDGGAPWSVVEDVTFRNNLVRHVAAGINILGRDDNHASQPTRRIAIQNNVFEDVGGEWGNGRLFQLLDGTAGVAIEHNTASQTGSVLFGGDNAAHTGFVFRNNLVPHNEHGITGSSTGPGQPTLERYFPGAVVTGNVIAGAPAAQYPRDNHFPASLSSFRPEEARGGRPGADTAAVERALGGLATVQKRGLTGDLRDESPALAALPTQEPPSGPAGGTGVAPWSVGSLAIFWVSALLLVYVYAGYPLIAALRARLSARPLRASPNEPFVTAPFVTIVVVAYNEASRIASRIENLLEIDYPADRYHVVVASDGSTDDTVERARAHEGSRVSVRGFPSRRGKAAVLNRVVPTVKGDIVVFADARQRFDTAALRALVRNFSDPAVGAVSGELMVETSDETATVGHGTAFYWRYEKFIRSAEARIDSTLGATGAIYAIRKSLFEPIPEDTILDDVLIPLRIVQRGFRVLFDPAARAYDAVSATAQQEFSRKARTIAGQFQLFSRESWLYSPRRNRLWFQTMSHKGLRLLLPVLHVVLFGAAWMLAAVPLYRWAFVAQVVFYAAALMGCWQRRGRRRSFLLSVPSAICLLSWATVVGFTRFATNRQRVTWERVAAPSRT